MAIREGNENNVDLTNMPQNTDVNPRLGLTTSQFVLVDDKDLTREKMKDDLLHAVVTGNTVEVNELTGRSPDVKRPEPSGATEVENNTQQNRDREDREEAERKRLADQSASSSRGKPGTAQPSGVATSENPLGLAVEAPQPEEERKEVSADTDLYAAAMRGDPIAIARIRLANKLREQNEHMDVDGDGRVDGGRRGFGPRSGLFHRTRFGGFVADDMDYSDSFGGTYTRSGYRSKRGHYTNTSGERYNADKNTFTEKNGKPMDVPASVKEIAREDKQAGGDFLEMAELAQKRIDAGQANKPEATNPGSANVDKTAAASKEGGALKTSDASTGTTAREVAAIGTAMKAGDRKGGKPLKANWQYLPEAERLQWRLHQQYGKAANAILKDRKQLDAFIKANRGKPGPDAKTAATADTTDKPDVGSNGEFTAVSKEEAEKLLKAQPVGAHHTADAKSSGDKVDAAASTTWYKDKDGGYWDEFGGYYDKTGSYWDTDGTYYSADGKFSIDPKGGTHWSDGSYTDTYGHTVDKDGNYVDFDGTKVKPCEDRDFKKEMLAAAEKGERWTPPERMDARVDAETALPSSIFSLPLSPAPNPPLLPLKSEALPLTASNGGPSASTTSAGLQVTTPSLSATTDQKITSPSLVATDPKASAALKVDTSKFTQAPSATPSSLFSYVYGGVHDWLMGGTKTTSCKDEDGACTLSSPLALRTGSTASTLASTTEQKNLVTPKPGM